MSGWVTSNLVRATLLAVCSASCSSTATEPHLAQASGAPIATRDWTFGRMPVLISLGEGPEVFWIVAAAATEAEAKARVDAIVAAGPGCEVPPGVTITLFVNGVFSGGAILVQSSTHGDFDRFTLTMGEDVIADLQSATNVVVTHPGHGWTTVSARLDHAPEASQDIQLTQRRVGDDEEEAVYRLRF